MSTEIHDQKKPRLGRLSSRIVAVITVIAGVCAFALPAMALPPFADGKFNFTMTGAGSDTTYFAMQDLDKLFNQAPGCNLTVPPATPQWNCVGDTTTTVTTENYDHEMAVEHFPQGSSAGLRMLCQENDNLGTIYYSYARSSSAPASIPTECQNAQDPLTYVGWAKDALGIPKWSGGASAAVTNLTVAQLKEIFLGTGPGGCNRNWSEFGGASAPIMVHGIQTSSGTYSAWKSFLGGDPNTCVSATGGQVLFENNCTPINNLANAADRGRSIWALSFGKYTTGEADCSPTGTSLISVGGVAPSATTIQDGTYQFNRTLFNVTRRNGPAWIAGYIGPAGWLCKANSLHSKPVGDPGPGIENANVDRNWGVAIDKTITANGFVKIRPTGDKCTTFDVN
jgi:ABC-type phosphate transport system substrate-binding protein